MQRNERRLAQLPGKDRKGQLMTSTALPPLRPARERLRHDVVVIAEWGWDCRLVGDTLQVSPLLYPGATA